jgi:hypothetical protein
MVQAFVYAEFNPDPDRSTRRFRNVVPGSVWMVAVSEPFPLIINPKTGFTPPFKYAWEGEGWIEYKRP